MNIEEISTLDSGSFNDIKSALPKSALDFVRIIGLEATLALISCFGGASVRFVKNENSWRFLRFSQVIGRRAAMKLGEEFGGGQYVYIPRCVQAQRMIRDLKIIRDFDLMMAKKGMSCREIANELAIKFSMSSRQIETIVNASN